MIVFGIDPSIRACGVAAVDRNTRRVLLAETIRTDTSWSDSRRYRYIYQRILAAVLQTRPRALAIEEQARVHVGKREKKQINASNSKTLQVFGLAMGAGFAIGVPVFVVTPQRAKIAVLGKGGGNANKDRVRAVVENYHRDEARTLGLDACDAIAIACGVPLVDLARAFT